MERLIITRGQHPNEAVAYSMAPKVRNRLVDLGHQVNLVTIPLIRTPFGRVIRGSRSYDKNWVQKTFSQLGANFLFSFHNSAYPDFESAFLYEAEQQGSLGKRVIVEIPAIYKPISNPSVLEKVNAYINSSPVGMAQRNSYADDYMGIVGSVTESQTEGLMTNEVIEQIAELIDSYIKEN